MNEMEEPLNSSNEMFNELGAIDDFIEKKDKNKPSITKTFIEEETKTQENFEGNYDEKICCIELINNNHIYLRYKETWTIRDLIKGIIEHKDFKRLYPQRTWLINSKHHLPLFDLHLNLYRSLREENETKVDFNIKLADLNKLGLLKNQKYAFFNFKDNRNVSNLASSYEEKLDCLKTIIKTNYEYFTIYTNYLPRVNTINLLNIHPQLEYYYQLSKLGLNKLSKFKLNPLISEDQKLDWFVYDDESMNFLISVEKKTFNVISSIRFDNKKVYLEDKYPSIAITNIDLSNFFIAVTFIISKNPLEYMTKKLKIDEQTTGLDILNIINKRLKIMKNSFAYEPHEKVLKVKSLNDYIFDLEAPLIRFAYIDECIRENITAEYYIVDNPFVNLEEILDTKGEIDEMIDNENNQVFTSGLNDVNILSENVKANVFNIASFVSSNENVSNAQVIMEKNDQGTVSEFMKSLLGDINNQVRERITTCSKMIDDANANAAEEDHLELGTTFNKSLISHSIHESILVRKKTTEQNQKRMTILNKSLVRNSTLIMSNAYALKKRIKNQENVPNAFTEHIDTPVDITSMLQSQNENISIRQILRPFSFIFRTAHLKQNYQSLNAKSPFSVISFKFQIIGGTVKYSLEMKIKWESNNLDTDPIFNKRIYMDLNYSTLPPFTSIIIKMEHAHYSKNKESFDEELIGWANFKLFDHHKRLRTGTHKLALYNTPFSDDSHFCYFEGSNRLSSSVCIELDTFALPVVNEPVELENFSYNIDSLIITESDQKKIQEIKKKTPFDKLNNYDKEVLWSNRYYLTQEPSVFAKLLTCIDYTNAEHLLEIEKLVSLAKNLSPIQALELLTGNYLHVSIRKFAVKSLLNSPPEEIQLFLIQLVQGLKYEMDHDSALASFLLTTAINYPLTIGHSLFWSLRSEMHSPNVQQRFGLYLEVFLNKIGKRIAQIYEDEINFIRELYIISDIPKRKKLKKEVRNAEFKDKLNKLNQGLIDKSLEVSMPLNFKLRIKGIKVEKCKPMKSKKKPLWLVFDNSDSIGEDIIVLYKAGDDLRMDIVTLQLYRIMQNLWFEKKLGLKMSLYKVICTGDSQGMLEIVKNADTLAQIHVKEGGALQSFSKTSLKNWLDKNMILSQEETMENFMLTSVAYCVATFVLGVGDRHSDNIMMKQTGELFHIDFGHFLGHFKYKMGIKRERAPFVFTKQFQTILGGEEARGFAIFKKKFNHAYQILRNNSDMLITLLRILLCSGIPELTENSIKYLDTSLCLNNNEEEARRYLEEKLDESLHSLSIEFNFWIHILANK